MKLISKKKKEDDEEKEKNIYVDIILLEDSYICAGNDKGYIDLFRLENNSFKGSFLTSIKAHEKTIISLDNIKKTKNKFVSCDNNNITLWKLIKKENEIKIECETVLKKKSESEIIFLYVLNNSDMISFINEDGHLIILNSLYQSFFNFKFSGIWLTTIYQIDSNDENDGNLIVGSRKRIFIFDKTNPKNLKVINCGCFFKKSIIYFKDNILLVGSQRYISVVDIKNSKLDYIIKINSSEISCFFKFNDIILCGYGDISNSHSFSYGVATNKNTKFCIIRKNKNDYESTIISNIFYNYGIINCLRIDKDKFISSFYHDDNIKVYQIKA